MMLGKKRSIPSATIMIFFVNCHMLLRGFLLVMTIGIGETFSGALMLFSPIEVYLEYVEVLN